MPRFHLHICDGRDFTEDEEGLELPDLAAARDAAIDRLRTILGGELRAGVLRRAAFVEVEDERRRLVLTVTFGEAVAEPAEPADPARPPRS